MMVGYFEKYALVVGLLSANVKSNPTTLKMVSKQNAITKQIAYLQRIMKAKMVAFTRAMIELAFSRPFQIADVGNTPKLELLSSFVMNNLENY